MTTRRQIFARFYSPGTFFAEISERPLETGTVEEATQVAKTITERYNATPFGFDLVTKIVADSVPDGEGGQLSVESKEVERRGRFFLGGKVLRFEDIEEGSIAASNMRGNGYPTVVENTNSFRSTQPFSENDIIVDPDTGAELVRGDAPDLVEYRCGKMAEWEQERRIQSEGR